VHLAPGAILDNASRRWRRLAPAAAAVVLGAAVVATASVVVLGSDEPAAAVFVSGAGSDRNPCTRDAPCASFGRAYRRAAPGEIIEIEGGAYPEQGIVADGRAPGSDRVVFRPAAGAQVRLAALRLGTGSAGDGPVGLTIASVTVAQRSGRQGTVVALEGTRDVVLEDIDAASFYLNGVSDFTISGGDWGPCRTTGDEAFDGCGNSKIDANPANRNITIEDAVFHDYRVTPGSGAHFECLIVFGGTDITVRRNRFRNCEFFDIFVQHASEQPVSGMRIENNWFDTPWNGAGAQNRPDAVAFSPRGTPFTDVLVGFNSFLEAGISVNDDSDGTEYSRFAVIGNIAASAHSGCYRSATFRSNLWIGSTCDPSDRSATTYPYASPVKGAAGDYHLTGGPAVDLVPEDAAGSVIDSDIDRDERPIGVALDAGADERG
jgi:hypothetical protein